ncbi:SAM-dependent methyltransferase [Microcoleus sp. B3-D7]|uniref:SAM-dependent methyltransferase n=1 Tax=Microcoleus sp. B3-D7 TaxID=2818659 RepID=UPI002FD0DC82
MSHNTEAQVSFTARLMAASRAFESKRTNRLFNDPFSEQLAGIEAMELMLPKVEEYEANGRPYVAVRTRFFDDFLMQYSHTIRQVVLLGAGMDTRAYRLDLHPETHYYEIDRASVLDYKESILKDITPKCHRHVLAMDLRETWVQPLVESGYRADQPSVWLLEGLLYYLSDGEVNELMATINAITLPGSRLGADLINEAILNSSGDLTSYWQSSCNHPESFFAEYGWNAFGIQPGEDGASFGRFTFQFSPRFIIDDPHIFFITANKTGHV